MGPGVPHPGPAPLSGSPSSAMPGLAVPSLALVSSGSDAGMGAQAGAGQPGREGSAGATHSPAFHLLSSSVTMSMPPMRLAQNSSMLSDSGSLPDIPAITTSSMAVLYREGSVRAWGWSAAAATPPGCSLPPSPLASRPHSTTYGSESSETTVHKASSCALHWLGQEPRVHGVGVHGDGGPAGPYSSLGGLGPPAFGTDCAMWGPGLGDYTVALLPCTLWAGGLRTLLLGCSWDRAILEGPNSSGDGATWPSVC